MQGMETAYVGNGVSASEASTTVGTEVIKAVAQKYQTNNQMGNATIEIDGFGTIENVTGNATVSVYTTDFEVEGIITVEDGILTWGEIETLTPGLTLKTTELILAPGEEGIIKYKLRGVNGSISWVSDNEKITVANGIVTVDGTADETDSATITVSIGEYTENCSVTVQEKWNDATIAGLNNMIGTEIANNSYTANNVSEWQIFYADSVTEEVFIISKNVIELRQSLNKNPNSSETENLLNDYATNGSATIADGSYGQIWNEAWITACKNATGEKSTLKNAQATAYLCDTTKWTRYAVSGVANYAVGGPTLQLLVASINANPNTSYSGTLSATSVGYAYPSISGLPKPYLAEEKSGRYGYWWLASPGSTNNKSIRGVDNTGNVNQMAYDSFEGYTMEIGVRPLVSIPLSRVKVKGTQVKIVP